MQSPFLRAPADAILVMEDEGPEEREEEEEQKEERDRRGAREGSRGEHIWKTSAACWPLKN